MHVRPLLGHASNETPGAATPETDLLNQMLAGSNRAWREFHTRYSCLAYSCIKRLVARFGPLVREDDISEVYAILLSRLVADGMHCLRTFDPTRGIKLGTWIGMLARNAAFDYFRAARREAAHEQLCEADLIPWNGPSAHDIAEQNERTRAAAQIFRRFSQRDREFVALYFGEQLAPEEVAAQLQISVNTVYSKKFKIQSQLRQLRDRSSMAA